MVPNAPASWYSCPCVSLSPWVWTEPTDLLLANTIKQVMSSHFHVRAAKDCNLLALPLALSLTPLTPMKQDTMLWDRHTMERPLRLGTREGSGPQLVGNQGLSQQGTRNCIPLTPGEWAGKQIFSSQVLWWLQPCKRPGAKRPSYAVPRFRPTATVRK